MAKYYSEFDWWCIHATQKIKYRPDRREVYCELYQHIEDRYQDFLEEGMDKEEAIQRTLQVMGSAEEIASQLAAIHRPFWGYLYSLCKWCFLLLAAIALLKFVPWLNEQQNNIQGQLVYNFQLPGTLAPFAETSYPMNAPEYLPHPWKRVYYSQPNCQAASDGYALAITDVAIWQEQCDKPDLPAVRDHLYIQMDITNPLPWAEDTEAPKWFWAEDNLCNYYYSHYEYDTREHGEDEYNNPEPSLIVHIHRTNFHTYTYTIWVRGLDYSNTEWITLHYDRSGRNIEFQINLTGGDTP